MQEGSWICLSPAHLGRPIWSDDSCLVLGRNLKQFKRPGWYLVSIADVFQTFDRIYSGFELERFQRFFLIFLQQQQGCIH